MVAGLTDGDLAAAIEEGRASRYQVVQGPIAHNSYHTYEIISVRHMQGLWLGRTYQVDRATAFTWPPQPVREYGR